MREAAKSWKEKVMRDVSDGYSVQMYKFLKSKIIKQNKDKEKIVDCLKMNKYIEDYQVNIRKGIKREYKAF